MLGIPDGLLLPPPLPAGTSTVTMGRSDVRLLASGDVGCAALLPCAVGGGERGNDMVMMMGATHPRPQIDWGSGSWLLLPTSKTRWTDRFCCTSAMHLQKGLLAGFGAAGGVAPRPSGGRQVHKSGPVLGSAMRCEVCDSVKGTHVCVCGCCVLCARGMR